MAQAPSTVPAWDASRGRHEVTVATLHYDLTVILHSPI